MMRIAWFRDTAPDTSDPLDDTAALIGELRAAHEIDVITGRQAHDFVWQQFLRPWDLCVYELDHARSSLFVRAYLLNYPGVLLLRSRDVPQLRLPLFASRVTVTSGTSDSELLRAMYPQLHVRHVPPCSGIGAPAPRWPPSGHGGGDVPDSRVVRFAVFDDRSRDGEVVLRAMRRARDAGAECEVVTPDADANVLAACDVVIAPGWPPGHAPAVLAAMAAGKAVVTTEMEATADWPAVDPHSWQPRGLGVTEPPIAVTIDPRDEEHSLMLAIRRLAADASSRQQLGMAAHVWWRAHAMPAHAAAVWLQILDEAVRLSPPPLPDDWPSSSLPDDGTGLARAILGEFGLLTRIGDQGSGP